VAQALRHLQLTLNMNFTRGRLTGDQDGPLDHIPPFQMRFLASWSAKSAGVDFSILYNAWKRIEDYNLNGEDNAQYATADGTLARSATPRLREPIWPCRAHVEVI
jgi:hemoglobin/transferrin/lactoferrin receptor protein